MLIQDDAWQPPTSPVGADIINAREKFILVVGGKKSGKTLAILDKVAKHLYEVSHAHVGLVVKRQEVGRIGVWKDFTEFTLGRVWQGDAGVLQYVQKPRVIANTKRYALSVRNYKGITNEVTLVNAYRDSEVEEIMKMTRFSLIYLNEADQFSEKIFPACASQLRMTNMGVPEEAHQMILDCNPPNEGDEHWLYKTFINPEVKSEVWRKEYRVITANIEDNPWLSNEEVKSTVQTYSSNKRLFARYILGEWIPSSEGSLFQDAFDESVHVIGTAKAGRPFHEWSLLLPPRGTVEIIRGWDPGDINHACVFMTKRLHEGLYCYDILDCIVSIDRPMSLRAFTAKVMERSEFWEGVLLRRDADLVLWKDLTDPSAFNPRSTGMATHALEIAAASKGAIRMRPVKKGPGSVQGRVSLITRLLGDGKIAVSVLARGVIHSLIGIRALKGGKIGPKHLKHAFDAFSYAISGEISGDLLEEVNQSQGRPEPKVMTISGG